MNSQTLVASLIVAGVLALLIAFIVQLMLRGWRKRAERQAELIGTLPEIPAQVGPAAITTPGIYVGCTMAPAWSQRILSSPSAVHVHGITASRIFRMPCSLGNFTA